MPWDRNVQINHIWLYNEHPMLAGVFDQLQKLDIRYQYQGIRLHKIDSMFYLRIFVEKTTQSLKITSIFCYTALKKIKD